MTWQIFLDRVTVFVKVTQPVNPNDYEISKTIIFHTIAIHREIVNMKLY